MRLCIMGVSALWYSKGNGRVLAARVIIVWPRGPLNPQLLNQIIIISISMPSTVIAFSFSLLCLFPLCLHTSAEKERNRYISYTVNYGEGFNLRRDVYMRVVTLVLILRRETDLNWILVLPPWPHLYHWRSPHNQNWLPWSKFFDLNELNKVVPCIEFSAYLDTVGYRIDEMLQLQRLKDRFVDGKFVEVARESECSNLNLQWLPIFGHENMKMGTGICLSAQGRVSVMAQYLQKKARNSRSFLIRNFEELLHEEYGGIEYWKIRKSMVYSSVLREAGNRFMIKSLGYNPGKGNGRSVPGEGGSMFVGAHLRRKDFLYSHRGTVPSMKGVIDQLRIILEEQKLNKVFVASDAALEIEFQESFKELDDAKVYWYIPSEEEFREYGDGGVAIIDQWILSHARYFIGTTDSTFSYRIREDRQFMGFSVESTFNDFCGEAHDESDPHSCPRPTQWLLVEEKAENPQQSKTEL